MRWIRGLLGLLLAAPVWAFDPRYDPPPAPGTFFCGNCGQPNDNHPLEPHSDWLRYGNNAFNCVVFGTFDGSHLSLCDWLNQTIAARLESPDTLA